MHNPAPSIGFGSETPSPARDGRVSSVRRLLHHQPYTDRHGRSRETRTWYLTLDGHHHALGADLDSAVAEARRILAQPTVGPGPAGRTLRVSDLLAMVEHDYRTKGKRSLPYLAPRFKHLLSFFRPTARALDLTTDVMVHYQAYRQTQGAAAGSINLELAALARGLSLARLYGRITHAPKIPYLTVHNARRGFFERGEFEAIAGPRPPSLGARLADTYRALVWSAYLTGWRPKAELLTRQWHHVDFAGGWMRLEQGETKNGDGREIPLKGELWDVLCWQRERCEILQLDLGRIVPWVFFKRDGSRLTGYFKPWERARQGAGMPNKLLYDCRRTRVRNFERAGVPRAAGMAWVGHRTEQMYRRYAIADRNLLEDAAAKAEAFEARQASGSTVKPHRELS